MEKIKLTQFIKPQHYARTILGLVLTYGVYIETGTWTAIAIGLILISSELDNILYQLTDYRIKQAIDISLKAAGIRATKHS